MAHRILILGAGTGGTLAANRLRREYSTDEATITVVDQDDVHVYQPGLLFVPFALARPDDIVRISTGPACTTTSSTSKSPIEAVEAGAEQGPPDRWDRPGVRCAHRGDGRCSAARGDRGA
ncbi:MAG: tryptophan 7-halogenase [Microthrixaceae bacterium]